VHIEDPNLPVKRALELLDKQNANLATKDWIITRGSESRDATSTHFAALIREQSLQAIKALNYRPYCGLDQARISVPGKERRTYE